MDADKTKSGIKQKQISKRLLVSIPIFILCFIIMLIPYEMLWRYFAWCNQVLSVFTLWAITIYLAKEKKNYFITLPVAIFMTCVTMTYIFFAPEGFSSLTLTLFNTAISYELAVIIGVAISCLFYILFARYISLYRKNKTITNK